MDNQSTAATLLIVGASIFMLGAAIGVPRVFTQSDPDVRQRMLEENRTAWRVAQPGYGAGAIISGAGVGVLAGVDAAPAFATACALLVAGSLAWCWSVYQRAVRIAEFARGSLPGWPFITYVSLTLVGLALLGVGLLRAAFPSWLGWLTLVADLGFASAYIRFKDIPPFVFYLLLLLVGIVLI